jgi:DNA-binding CsgD family transcriptional regulator
MLMRWLKVRRFLFVDKFQTKTFSENIFAKTVNLIFDAVDSSGDVPGCFYYLVNIDQTQLAKYQLVMKLLLLSALGALNRISKRNTIPVRDDFHLTEREKQIILRIRRGLNNKSIASQLNISVNTVKCHIYNIFQKLQATNRVDALIKAESAGYIN